MSHPEGQPFIGRYWRPLSGLKLVCNLCPRRCQLREGQRGFCFVRQNVRGQLVLTTYGRSSGFCIDPIEKKPLNHFYPGTSVLSFGTAGCNLGCKFCQNWSISKSREFETLAAVATPAAIACAAKQHNCTSVAFTYNDPVIFAEYAIDVARACHEHGIKTVAVTAGYITAEARPDFYQHMDAANVDLKAFSERFYKKITLGNLSTVCDTLQYIKHETSVWLEITTLLIPDENDSDAELAAMTGWIHKHLGSDVPIHFSAFHPDFRMSKHPATPATTLTRARDIARREGLRYVYTGNVHDVAGGSTYCHACNARLIERDWYRLGAYRLVGQNRCPECGTVCAGCFADAPGSWGARRQPVQIEHFQ